MRQVQSWEAGVCTSGFVSTGCVAAMGMAASEDPKYHSTALHPKKERPGNKGKGSLQTSKSSSSSRTTCHQL